MDRLTGAKPSQLLNYSGIAVGVLSGQVGLAARPYRSTLMINTPTSYTTSLDTILTADGISAEMPAQ